MKVSKDDNRFKTGIQQPICLPKVPILTPLIITHQIVLNYTEITITLQLDAVWGLTIVKTSFSSEVLNLSCHLIYINNTF